MTTPCRHLLADPSGELKFCVSPGRSPHDIFVVPSWVTVRRSGHSDAVLFSYSDRAVQDKLDLLREERL